MRSDVGQHLGHLHDDLTALAGKVRYLASAAASVVWADHAGAVYIGDIAQADQLPENWLIGAYADSPKIAEIEEDLREVLRQRTPGPILD